MNQQTSFNNNNNTTYLWDMKTNQLSNWLESRFLPTDNYNFKQHEGIRTVLFRNLCIALEATKAISINDSNDNTLYYSLQDPYRIWFEVDSVWDTLSHALPTNAGEKLCRLSVAGLINAMSGMDGGVVDSSCSSSLSAEEDVLALTSYSLREIKEVASLLHETIGSFCRTEENNQSVEKKHNNSMDTDYCYYSSEDGVKAVPIIECATRVVYARLVTTRRNIYWFLTP